MTRFGVRSNSVLGSAPGTLLPLKKCEWLTFFCGEKAPGKQQTKNPFVSWIIERKISFPKLSDLG